MAARPKSTVTFKDNRGEHPQRQQSSESGVLNTLLLPQRARYLLICILAVFLRWTTALSSYSGRGEPPLFGDYEAQRHWMELTVHLPPKEWYSYDTSYWGLDYPPLTAYVSWIFGNIAHAINPEWVAFHTSRGHEAYDAKLFMRTTVLTTDLLIYFPAVLAFVRVVMHRSTLRKQQLAVALLLCQPALILIDHGHFQYNNVMLGLSMLSIVFLQQKKYLDASVAFILALLFKQMTLYYAPTIFVFILAQCFRNRQGYILFFKVAVTVVAITGLLLLPFQDLDTLQQIIRRVFPIARGLYQDKVANVWCAMSPFFKLREHFSKETLLQLSLVSTVTAFTPSLIFLWRKPTLMSLIYAFAGCSLSFFLFSFQVHEKTILVPMMPLSLLLVIDVSRDRWTWRIWNWMMNIGCFSIYPLLKKDGVILPYFCLILLWNWMIVVKTKQINRIERSLRIMEKCSYAFAITIHLLDVYVSPPKKLPDLYIVLNVVLSCATFLLGWALVNLDFWAFTRGMHKEKEKAT